MRQVFAYVPRGRGAHVMEVARRLDATNVARLEAHDERGPCDVVVAHLPNRAVEQFLADVEDEEGLRVSLAPQGVMALHPPKDDAPRQVTEVEPRSPVEVFLAGLQSVGSWKGFLGYAAAGGAIAWVGLVTGTIYLLVAAMLVAPFAGPAMNAALASARGDVKLLARSLARYLGAIALSVAVSAVLTWAFRPGATPPLAVEVANVSAVTVLLPLTAGAAGALNLAQSEHKSLVSGAAVGILVAASLAPPAGALGIALVAGEWGIAWASTFLLALQLVGINLSGALVFRLFGVNWDGVRYDRGSRAASRAALALTLVVLAGLVAWQLHDPPGLQRATLEQRAQADVRAAVEESGLARVVDAQVRFTRAEGAGDHPLLAVVYARPAEGVDATDEEIEERLEALVEERLRATRRDATPLVDVVVVGSPGAQR